MTISEKIKQSACPGTFTLYKEGMFYKCYNEDAMVFSERANDLKIRVKYINSASSVALDPDIPIGLMEQSGKTQPMERKTSNGDRQPQNAHRNDTQLRNGQ